MALTNGLEAIKVLLSCVQADSSHVSHVIVEEKQTEAKLKKLTISELAPGVIVLATDEGRKRTPLVCMSPLFADDGKYDQNRACDAVKQAREKKLNGIRNVNTKHTKIFQRIQRGLAK